MGAVSLYIEANLLADLPDGSGRLIVYMGDYGTWRLRIGGSTNVGLGEQSANSGTTDWRTHDVNEVL